MNKYSKALRQPPSDIKPKDTTKQIEILRKALRKEDGMAGGAPVNNVGGGSIAGAGVGPQGEPGVGKKKKPMPFKSFFKRKDPAY
jgi:hypothetical protein